LQQVAANSYATAQIVDPRQLPVPVPDFSRKALISLGHVWVLHRAIVIRVVAAAMVLFVAVGLYQARDVLVAAGEKIGQMVQGEFAAAGFGIEQIQISGQNLTTDAHIYTMMALTTGASTLTFDVQKAAARLHWLAAVESATVRRVFPDKIVVEIVEKKPLIRWRMGDAVYLVDAKGEPIAKDDGSYTELPLVVGDGAPDDALIMVNSLARHDILKKDLAALSRIGDRRWDLIYYTGLRVQLPEQGVAQALDQLEMYQRDYALLDRDVTLIDLRVPGMMSVKPGELAKEQFADAAKAGKKKKKAPVGDADYETPAERTAEAKQQ
jgi:cell division protein FtsQ